MENPDAYRAGTELVEFEWRQNHRNYYSSFSLKFYQENDMPLLTGWFPSQSGGDEIRESQTDAFSNPIPWQLTWVQWFALQNVLAESELPAYRKPSSDSYDEVDSEIRIVWRTDDGDEAQTLSGSQAEALEALVLGIAEEAYAASKLETEQREVRETAELVGIYWEQTASSARDCFSFLLDERTLPSRPEKQMLFSYRYQDGDGKPIFRQDIAVEPEKAQACFSSIGQELRALDLPVYHPSAGPDGAENSCICATWQDGSEVFTNNYGGLVGPFFVCGLTEDSFCSLPPDQMERFKKKFHKAEILLGFRGDEPVTLKVEPKQKNATPEKQRKPPSQER